VTGETFPVKKRGDTIGIIMRVPVEQHMANYRAARALIGKGRNADEGAAGLSKKQRKEGG